MKKQILMILLIGIFSMTACGPMKVTKMQQIGVKNQTMVMYFSRKIKHSFVLSIDNKPVPVAAPATGRLLQIHNLKPGTHHITIRSDWYIFNMPIRDFSYQPEKNETAVLFSALKYSEDTRPIQEKNKAGLFRRMLNTILFWRGKETDTAVKIDTTKVYGEFTD